MVGVATAASVMKWMMDKSSQQIWFKMRRPKLIFVFDTHRAGSLFGHMSLVRRVSMAQPLAAEARCHGPDWWPCERAEEHKQ